jgi:hypothetical protein
VKKYPDNRTPLTYAGRAIGTVGTVTSVLHQLKAHCLKGDTEKSLPTIYHIAKAALVQQTGEEGRCHHRFRIWNLIRTRTGDDWSPITNEQEATFDPSDTTR